MRHIVGEHMGKYLVARAIGMHAVLNILHKATKSKKLCGLQKFNTNSFKYILEPTSQLQRV